MSLHIFDHRRDVADPIPNLALLWLAIGLVLSAVPFFGQVPYVALGAVCVLAFWRYRIQITGGRLPPTWLRLALFLTAIGLNVAVFRTIFNMDAAMVLLLVLVGLKLLELRTERDFNLVAYLCFFLVLAALFYNVSLPLFCFQLGVIISITAALIRLHVGPTNRFRLTEALGRSAMLFLQALPLIALLYVLFPRFGGSFGGAPSMNPSDSGTTGMSDTLSPGSMASVSLSEEPVLRASFPETDIPLTRDLYWRGQVMVRCRGFMWEPGDSGSPARALDVEGRRVKQHINLEPHNGNWIFALDRPVGIPPRGTEILGGQYISSRVKITSPRQYEVTSMVSPSMGSASGLGGRERRDNLDIYAQLPPRIADLALSWRKDALDHAAFVRAVFEYAENRRWRNAPSAVEAARLTREWRSQGMNETELARRALDYALQNGWVTDEKFDPDIIVRERLNEWMSHGIDAQEVVDNAINWFRANKFLYTTSPGTYEGNVAGLEDFLFNGRKGFCEHYSAALGLLLRAALVPTRVVTGYQGGSYNRVGNLMLVRQGDAHAWNEVWFADKGWTRVDLTNSIAPDRLEFGMDAFRELESSGAVDASERLAALSRLSNQYGLTQVLRDMRFAVDAFDYYWNFYVLSYDEGEQSRLISRLGISVFDRGAAIWKLLVICACGCLALLVLSLFFMALVQRPPRRDFIHRAYAELRQRLSAAGVPVLPSDGPLELSQRASAHLPAQAPLLESVFETYIRLRYARPDTPEPTTADLHRWLGQIRRVKLR